MGTDMERADENDSGASYGLSINLGPAEEAISRPVQALGQLDVGR